MTKPAPLSYFIDLLVRRIAAGFKIPEPAIRMFQTANELSGLDRKTLPTELIPLNTIQISRGLLNFTLLQSLEGWVLPYWAERQFDPADAGFIPRSHLGLSINITRRNWTAVGSPSCADEPVVDPCGAVMPHRNRWTVECWVKGGRAAYFPSRATGVRQALRAGLPIVTTAFDCGGARLEQDAYVNGTTLVQQATVTNTGDVTRSCTLAFAIRPFNAEGACLLRALAFDGRSNAFIMDGADRLALPGPPDSVCCSNHAGGDSARRFASTDGAAGQTFEAACPAGLANGYASYSLTLAPGESRTFRASVSLDGTGAPGGDLPQAEETWSTLAGSGAQFTTPDEGVNMLVRASVSTLLLLADGDSITPGPWTYHQFWFRDAALMIRALDAFGFHAQARGVILSFPSRQEGSGYFRSQQGEWDSNGEALWTVWQHAVLSGDPSFLPGMLDALGRGAAWIARKRTEENPENAAYPGLMPAGLSAEHLGLADRYFWDNWWSAAGLGSYARLCSLAGKRADAERARAELKVYMEDIERAVSGVRAEKGIEGIPAGPARDVDCGMIGSCAPWYPLQIYGPGDARMRRTLETLSERYFLNGLFFQQFIHSGKNPYLTLQVAQAWLHAGERERFWRIFTDVAAHASPTWNYPEAIHPGTGGGTMGDGHHGWAAAEIAFALRSAFVREAWSPESDTPELVLLSGVPAAWLLAGNGIAARRAPVPGGILGIAARATGETLTVEIDYETRSGGGAQEWSIRIPGKGSRVTVNGRAARAVEISERETAIRISAAAGRTVLAIERQADEPAPHPANR